MTLEIALVLLAILPIVTSILTEFVKKMLDMFKVTYASNVVVLVMACIVGGGSTILYYMAAGIPWTVLNIILIFAMIITNAVGATIDYDKGKQLITQIMAIVKK